MQEATSAILISFENDFLFSYSILSKYLSLSIIGLNGHFRYEPIFKGSDSYREKVAHLGIPIFDYAQSL